MVAMPLIMIASWGLSPMTSGKTKVAPNIATTCWAPRPTVLPHDRRSSGATTSSGPASPVPLQFPTQAQRHGIASLMRASPSTVTRLTHRDTRTVVTGHGDTLSNR